MTRSEIKKCPADQRQVPPAAFGFPMFFWHRDAATSKLWLHTRKSPMLPASASGGDGNVAGCTFTTQDVLLLQQRGDRQAHRRFSRKRRNQQEGRCPDCAGIPE